MAFPTAIVSMAVISLMISKSIIVSLWLYDSGMQGIMGAKQIIVLGGGFAGLWSAVGAVRKLDELGVGPDAVQVTLVNCDAFHCIRVRNYETDLDSVRVPLDSVLGPICVSRVEGEVAEIDAAAQEFNVTTATGPQMLRYDRLVFALGSQLAGRRLAASRNLPLTWIPTTAPSGSTHTFGRCLAGEIRRGG